MTSNNLTIQCFYQHINKLDLTSTLFCGMVGKMEKLKRELEDFFSPRGTQSFVARELGVTRQYVSLWKRKPNTIPFKRVNQLSRITGIPQIDFIRFKTSNINSHMED